jgi:hypothetical protein
MQHYSNLSGSSGVIAYHTGSNYIDIQFQDGSIYRYTYNSAGLDEVEEMKQLAALGKGLTTFINQHVRENYATKLK